MRFEHFALNVPDSRAHARWYVENLGFSIARQQDVAPFTHFLADESGRVAFEFYTNPKAPIPDYFASAPLTLHIAVVAADARAEQARLEKAGAKLAVEETLPNGSLLIMLRDPWGVSLQLCQRTNPFPVV